MFIVAAILLGVIDRVIWVWPDWDVQGKRHEGDEVCACTMDMDIDIDIDIVCISTSWKLHNLVSLLRVHVHTCA